MAVVPLTFIPPTEHDIVALHIYESNNSTDGFVEIERTASGTYPDYINNYTTTLANFADDWFAIAWENAEGAISPLSAPIQGGTTTLIGEIVNRVLLRVPDEDENIIVQEAEATVSFIYKVDDPYSIDINSVSKLWLTELVNLTLVASQYISVITQASAGQEYTAGMVSQGSTKGDADAILTALERLEKRSLKRLGIGGSLIASIAKDACVYNFTKLKTTFDSSRVLSARAVITESMIVRDLDSGITISER